MSDPSSAERECWPVFEGDQRDPPFLMAQQMDYVSKSRLEGLN